MHSVPSHSASKPHDSDYSRNRARSIRFLILLAAILALAFFLSLRAGSYNTPAAELIRGIFGRASDAKINLVIRNNRLPRICTAMVAGAGLGLAGCILQAVLRNPLASASTLGVSQGATFGAAVAIIGLGLSQAGSWAIPLCSFLGSLLVAAVILGLSQFKQISSEGIVLAGVAISSMLTGATTLLQYFADEVALSSLVFWTFGDLGSTDWQSLRGMVLAVLLLIGYCYLHRWDYNALLSGEETALSLGIHVRRLTLTNVVLTCFVCSVIVSHVGLINFIGLVAPHIVRMVVGNNYIYLIPGSVLAGAALLLLSDLAARVIIMPVILPIGALTAFLIFNFHPAKIFMGDTGSLYLGGLVCGLTVLYRMEILLFLIGFVYLIEGLSVMLQVAYFKKTGKRIFKMAPLHHHFEMNGWSEVKIVFVFTFVTALTCAAAYWGAIVL